MNCSHYCSLFIFLLFIFSTGCSSQDDYEIPLAPYNVKLMCRQGRRFSKQAQTPSQCPSSSTSCGFFEFPMPDSKNGNPTTGAYDCVDGGIISENSGEVEDDSDDRAESRIPEFFEMCGAVPKCTSIPIDQLNPQFVKYMVQEYDIKLEGLETAEIRFCCALFHSTLQKLVTSPSYQFHQTMAPPVSCQGKMCDAGAVGCLLHALHDEEEYEDYDERRKRRQKRLALNDYIEDDGDYVNAVELNFDDLDIELITRETPIETTESSAETTAITTLPSLKLPMSIDDLTTTSPIPTTPSTATTLKPTTVEKSSKSKTFNTKHYYEEVEEYEPDQTTHCVYRHLNNEFYRYCLLVHQSRDGDRCYHHQGHTICCCFVAPDRETCDPTEMDLVVPPPQGGALPPRVIVTIPPTTTTTTTTTSTTTTTTTTPEPTTEVPTDASTTTTTAPSKYPPLPTQIYRQRPIDQIKRRKQMRKKCRVAYVRTKSGSRTRPVLVCDDASRPQSYAKISYLLPVFCSFFFYLQVF